MSTSYLYQIHKENAMLVNADPFLPRVHASLSSRRMNVVTFCILITVLQPNVPKTEGHVIFHR